MSEWCEILDENIEVDFKEKEINILVNNNSNGTVYGVLTFKQAERIMKEMHSLPWEES